MENRTCSLSAPMFSDMNKHTKILNILSKIAIVVEPVSHARITAALVYKNDIISIGMCKNKSHPFQAIYSRNSSSIFLHAETDCIKNALKIISLEEISKATLYICRVKFEDNTRKKFVFGMAKPCEGCTKAIATYDIKNICYTLDDGSYQLI